VPERLEVTLDGLRQLRERIRQLQLEPGDWPVMDALVSDQILRTEEKNERRIAKFAAAAEETSGPEASSHAGESTFMGLERRLRATRRNPKDMAETAPAPIARRGTSPMGSPPA
jgi:hypothetical protein